MKSKNVFVLIVEWCIDCENGVDVSVYSTAENARAAMKRTWEENVAESRFEHDHVVGGKAVDGYVLEEDEDFIILYEDGNCLENHVSYKVEQHDIDECVANAC